MLFINTGWIHGKRSNLAMICLGMLMLSSCQTYVDKSTSEPEWLSNLYYNDNKNIYGVAKPVSAGDLSPVHYAKLNAIENWCISESTPLPEITSDLTDVTSYNISNTTVYFNDVHWSKGGVYALASNKMDSSFIDNRAKVNCDLKRCQPSWLCENKSGKMTVLGVSAVTEHPNEQLRYIIENGQQLARMINKAAVYGVVETLHLTDGKIDVANTQERYRISELAHQSSAAAIKGLCEHKGNLVGQVEFDVNTLAYKHDWLNSPNLRNVTGVVGFANGATSTGRISDLIKVAARKGLFELAKAKNITIENELELKVTNEGLFSLVRKSVQKTESVVSAYIADMKMELDDNYQPIVNIWLLENKG